MGPLVGIVQSIDRAELTALVGALRWSSHHRADVCLWSDSLSTTRTAAWIQAHDCIPAGVANYDLWLLVHEEIRQGGSNCLWFRWVAAHIHPSLAEDPLETWLIKWNDAADKLAARANENRALTFWQLHGDYEQQLTWWHVRLQQLREFYFAIAVDNESGHPTSEQSVLPAPEPEHDDESLLPQHHVSLEDELPVNWQLQCESTRHRVPSLFINNLINWWCAVEENGDQVQVLSEVELVFALLSTQGFSFPFRETHTNSWVFRQPDRMFQKPTFSELIKAVQFALKSIISLFPNLSICATARSDPLIGIVRLFKCYRLRIDGHLYQRTRQRVALFTENRPLRRSCDLARPAV